MIIYSRYVRARFVYLEYRAKECQESIQVRLCTLFLGSVDLDGIKDDSGG